MSHCKQHSFVSKGYVKHEFVLFNLVMFLRMVLSGGLVGLLGFLIYLNLALASIDRPFSKTGLGENAFRDYILNKYIFAPLFPGAMMNLEPEFRLHLGKERVTREEYVRLFDRVVSRHLNPEIIVSSERTLFSKLKQGFFFYLAFLGIYITLFAILSRRIQTPEYLRGAQLLTRREFINRVDHYAGKGDHVKIGDLVFPQRMEILHTLVFGATGTGKSVLTNQYVDGILRRREKSGADERLILYDVKGEAISIFFKDCRDCIFCPFDQRSIRWSFFNEIWSYPDYDIICKKLFLNHPGNERNEFWYNAARSVFRCGLLYLDMIGKRENGDIVWLFAQPLEKLKELLYKTLPLREQGALKHISGEDQRIADSVMSIIQDRIDFFKYLVGRDGDFSFRRFVRDDTFSGTNLFLLNLSMYSQVFSPLLTFAIDVMAREVLLKPDLVGFDSKRTHFIVDEINSLGRIDSIIDFVTQARVKGGSLFATAQDTGKLLDLYGRNLLTTINNNCNTKITFRVNDFGAAKYCADDLGETQELRKSDSHSLSPSAHGDRSSINEQEKREPLVLASEIQQLEDRECYIKLPNVGITKMKLPLRSFERVNTHFLPEKFEKGILAVDGRKTKKLNNKFYDI